MIGASNATGLGVAITVALVLALAYFIVTGGWTNLANPIAGIVAVFSGIIGSGVAVAIDRRQRARPSTSSG